MCVWWVVRLHFASEDLGCAVDVLPCTCPCPLRISRICGAHGAQEVQKGSCSGVQSSTRRHRHMLQSSITMHTCMHDLSWPHSRQRPPFSVHRRVNICHCTHASPVSQIYNPATNDHTTLANQTMRTGRLQTIPVKLLPGVPVTPVLGDGHPFHTGPVPDDIGEEALLEPGSALPPFTVRARDAYGNTCVPSASLQWNIELHSEGITPSPGVAASDASGAAALQNVHIAAAAKKGVDWSVPAELRVVAAAAAEGLQGAVAAAEVEVVAGLKLLVAPSRAPAAMTVMLDEHELPFEVVEGAEGESRRAFQVRPAMLSLCHAPCQVRAVCLCTPTLAKLCCQNVCAYTWQPAPMLCGGCDDVHRCFR